MGRHDFADQRAFARGENVYAMPDAVRFVSLAGPDALALVAALTTLPPGVTPTADGQEALALDARGHILFGMTALPVGTDWLVITDAPAEELAEHFRSRRFRRRVEITARPDLRALVAPGPIRAAPATDPGAATDPDPAPAARGAAGRVATRDEPWRAALPEALGEARDWWPGAAGRPDGIGPRYAVGGDHPGRAWAGLAIYPVPASATDELAARLGRRQIDPAALEALRIAAWRPLASSEAADGRTLPHELDWLRGVAALDSGCYPGQETVAKIVNLGKPPRRLVFLHLDGSSATLPAAGAPVWLADPRGDTPDAVDAEGRLGGLGGLGGGELGRVTAAAAHHELGPIALALIKRDTPLDARLGVGAADAPGGAVAASQIAVVPPSGESDARPARHGAPPRSRKRILGR
ncbi:MAG: tRNA-modifying protein YgfZ [Bifidobacteriaceae bacterium]|jgi:folate-binding protein YgfZ|nr:tRNA-modifying protein YgfZ [Bifidobacteriaceae bacterium]